MAFSMMQRNYLVAVLVLLFCPTRAHPKKATREVCTLKAECHQCTGTDIDSIPECKATGKMETFSCVTTENESTVDTRHKVQSCQRTRADEDYLMIQLQVLCLLIGTFSFTTVRRQRTLYASGFDQRKANSSQYTPHKPPRGGVAGNGSLQRESTAEERVPLADGGGGETDPTGIEVV